MSDLQTVQIQKAAVAKELELLMRKKQMDATPLAEFPQLGSIFNSTVDDGAGIRRHLQRVVEGLGRDEKERAAEIEAAGGLPDRPFTATAMVLFGFTPRSAHKKIGQRRTMAASVRKVAPRTMRTHEKLIAEELAEHLCPDSAAHPRAALLKEQVLPYASLAALSPEEWSALLDILSREELRRLLRELALGYKDFADSTWGALGFDWHGSGLQLLGERGFRDYLSSMTFRRGRLERKISLRSQFLSRVLSGEKSTESRYGLIVQILQLMDRHLLPSFSTGEQDHIERITREAGGQEYVFLEKLEETEQGREIAAKWFAMNSILSDAGSEGVTAHTAIRRGFEYVWQALYPDNDHRLDKKALRKYMETRGWTDPLLPYERKLEREMDWSNYTVLWVHKMGGMRRAANLERAHHHRMMGR